MIGSIQDWHALFKEAYRCTKPGGWIQSFEVAPYMVSDDGTVPEDSAMARCGPLFVEGGKILGKTFTVVEDGTQRSGIEDAGFINIHEANYKVGLTTLRLTFFQG